MTENAMKAFTLARRSLSAAGISNLVEFGDVEDGLLAPMLLAAISVVKLAGFAYAHYWKRKRLKDTAITCLPKAKC
jgi:hypothetical protein